MLCTRPFVRGLNAYPCGQCMPCRINRRRLWTHRMILEARLHEHCTFVTLTYDKEHHPPDGSLRPRDLTLWLKRLRKLIAPLPLRYYACGEYGGDTWRPHYHAALFGLPSNNPVISLTWLKGFTMAAPLSPQSMAYIAGYVTKKMTQPDDSRLSGRAPEFARMSLRPGIGAHAMGTVATALMTRAGASAVAQQGDVPMTLQHGRQSMPLGRYLRTKLREEVGVDQAAAQGSTFAALKRLEMHELREKVGRAAFALGGPITDWAKVSQVEARARIWKKNETL